MASLEHHDQALLECILSELKLKGLNGLNFAPKKTTTTKKTAGPAGHIEHLLTPGVSTPETWSETPSPSASTMSTQSTSVESSPLLRPKQLCLDAEKIQLPLAELLPTPTSLVTWRVMNPNAKFKASCGFPLVSHQLSNHLLEDFRVIFAAGNTWASQNKGKKQQASSKAASKFGTLQLKFLGDEAVGDLQLFFHIGAYKLGPFRTFPERSVSELCELPVDWRRLVEKADMSLAIGVEVVA